jgi:hypothetical protein
VLLGLLLKCSAWLNEVEVFSPVERYCPELGADHSSPGVTGRTPMVHHECEHEL